MIHIIDFLPSLKVPEGRGFLLVPRLSGNTFGGGAHRSIPTQAHKAHAQVWHGESPTGDALRLRARFAKFCADFESELVQRSEEHTSELQSHHDLVCRLLLEKKKKKITKI